MKKSETERKVEKRMGEKKNLKIDAMKCDLRGVTEEVLTQYESISIDAMVICVTEASLALLHKYHVKMDAMSIEKMEEDDPIVVKNGSFVIQPGQEGDKKVNLVVNGHLKVEKGSNEVLKNYKKITVNGHAVYPQSAAEILSSIMSVNGSETVYPDGENIVLLEGSTEIDRTFLVRAKENTCYFSMGTVIFLDEKADYGKLAAKNVSIQAPRAIMTEEVLERVGQCLDEKANVELVPDGCIFIKKNEQLDDSFAYRYGTKVYVSGNLDVADKEALEQMEFIRVSGNVMVKEELKKGFLRVCKDCGNLLAYRGTLFMGRQELVLDAAMLEEHPEGITIADCISLKLEEDVDIELVKEHLRIFNCINVSCARKLVNVISEIAKGCQNIGPDEADEEEEQDENTIYIDAMTYKM